MSQELKAELTRVQALRASVQDTIDYLTDERINVTVDPMQIDSLKKDLAGWDDYVLELEEQISLMEPPPVKVVAQSGTPSTSTTFNQIKRKSLKGMADDPDVIAWRAASANVEGWKAELERIGFKPSDDDGYEEYDNAEFNIKHWTAEWTRLDKIVDDKRIRLAQEEHS